MKLRVSFDLFWNSYHEITDLKKSDKDPSLKYWDKLNNIEKEKALNNIKPYWDSLKDKKYCKKARTYLSDKNFNDEFKKTVEQHTVPNDGIERFKVSFVGDSVERILTQEQIKDWEYNRQKTVKRKTPCN